jgi:predicted MFS family arabinose efflux permease
MSHPRLKNIYFLIAGLHCYAATFYFNYLFFLLRDRFGFDNRDNLMVGALHGLIYTCGAWYGGQFAQRRGYLNVLALGVGGMALALATASAWPTIAGQVTALAIWTLFMSFTWPTLEAMVSEQETTEGLIRRIGVYNQVWAGAAALAYCTGGMLFEVLGRRSIYWLPIGLHGIQLLMLLWLMSRAPAGRRVEVELAPEGSRHPEPAAFHPSFHPHTFLKLAWLAIPFSYIAINTLLAVIPGLALRLQLSTAESGAFCSIWFFVRLGTFLLLWRWTGWHYRFGWLAGACAGLVVSFATLLLAERLWVLIFAQIIFGLAVGLIYYSSLFYSMDVGDSKGEHGGFHEAAIGSGIFLGPAIGAGALTFFPTQPNGGAWAVSGVLLLGLVGVIAVRMRR